ncbi:serine/threonine protein kinase [Amycolatopsis sp. FU40]|uniref:serine/threonine-protein kinase n=1 Tax=Amycolatopsis sp. FU40 TaxID=2914159 RepID=UPI001F4554F7|nr:serine/threonine-protein kinase [Amycolatopsis sp. FU40]UKD57918.1 serine/threonine protein kinase [Amycolatopsis sp. FU40]
MDETEAPTLDRPDITGRLPRYRLVRQLARTRMSEVFEAVDTADGRAVALKVVGPEFMAVPGFRTRFERETRIARELGHPNVVPVRDAGFTEDGCLGYLAMEYVRGTNLARLLAERGPLSFKETVGIGREIAAALDAAHERRLVHRDVKPGNILLDADGRAYLCDFGIARRLDLTQLTATGAFLGTVGYAAPEQRQGKPAGSAADVYSLACVLCECLAGAPPGHHAEPGHPGVRALRRSLSTDPEARHPTCTALIEELIAAQRRNTRRRRTLRAGVPAVAAAGLLVASLTTGRLSGVDDATLARIPAALRADCATADTPVRGATATVTCHDPSGRAATTALYADPKQAADAYSALPRLGASTERGDCAVASWAEHRYPATGPALGRVFCGVGTGRSIVVWTDDAARSVTTATAPASDDAALRAAWVSWTGAPAFPTPDEKGLAEIAAGNKCRRATPADLGDYPGAIAGITCTPRGTGARDVSYYRFADTQTLRTSFDGLVTAAKAPSGTPCPGASPGTTRFDWLSVDLGQVLCRPGKEGTVAIDWSLDSFHVVGHVTGPGPVFVGNWWTEWHLAPLSRIVAQVNREASPAFPTPAENKLLQRIPPASRINCVRPSADQRWQDLGAVQADAAVACGQTSGAGLAVYYQLPDTATMNQVFNSTQTTEKACTDQPPDFAADRPYSRGGRTGRLACATLEPSGERYLKWTDDQSGILAVAHRGASPFAMVDWWNHDSGPS